MRFLDEQLNRLTRFLGRKTKFLQPDFIKFGAQYQPRPLAFINGERSFPVPNHPPKISVVIPSFNQAPFLERAIQSVIAQNYPNIEIMVVDGGSTDGSQKIIRKLSHYLTWWCSEPDRGQAHALNKGFVHANGEIMAWLNSDDCLVPGVMARVADYFTLRHDVEVVYGHRIMIDERGKEIGRWILPRHSSRVLNWADFIPQETLFWRRTLWDRIGGKLNEEFRFAMDWELLLRFQDSGAEMVRLPFFIGLFRVHEGQKTSSEIEEMGFPEMQRLRSWSLGSPPPQYRVAWAVIGYLLQAKFLELLWKTGLVKYD